MIKFENLFFALIKARVRYLVVGGIAVNLYGIEMKEKTALEKLQWLEVQMEFFHKAMPEKAKGIRERLFS